MSSPELTLRAFGEEIGMAGLTFGDRASVTIRTDSGRQLGVEQGDHAMLVHLSQPVGHDAADLLLKAWKRAHHACAGDMPLQVALRDRGGELRLLVLVRIRAAEFTVLRLHQTLDHLSRWLDALRHD